MRCPTMMKGMIGSRLELMSITNHWSWVKAQAQAQSRDDVLCCSFFGQQDDGWSPVEGKAW